MASMALSICPSAKPLLVPPTSTASASSSSSSSACYVCRCSPILTPVFRSGCFVATICQKNYSRRRRRLFVVCMAPDEEQLTRRNPLDFPIEWERPKPGRRPDIFPQFSPMKTPIPPPLPYDPPEEDEEEEEEKKKEEEEEDPEKEEEPDNPEKQ